MKESTAAIIQLFTDETNTFLDVLVDYFKNNQLDFEDITAAVDGDEWRIQMDADGVREMKGLESENPDWYILNATYENDDNFSAIGCLKAKSELMDWLIDLAGFSFNDMSYFDPTDYEEYDEDDEDDGYEEDWEEDDD